MGKFLEVNKHVQTSNNQKGRTKTPHFAEVKDKVQFYLRNSVYTLIMNPFIGPEVVVANRVWIAWPLSTNTASVNVRFDAGSWETNLSNYIVDIILALFIKIPF